MKDADGNPERNAAGTPAVLAFVVPRDTVELTGNWDVMGLRGTGSFDYTIREQFVEAGRTFWLFECEPRCGGAMYRLGSVAFAGIGHPDKFFDTIARAGGTVALQRSFPDHHVYTAEELDDLASTARTAELDVLTTAKDAARLKNATLPGDLAGRLGVLEVDAVFDSRAAAGRIVEETVAAWNRRRISS